MQTLTATPIKWEPLQGTHIEAAHADGFIAWITRDADQGEWMLDVFTADTEETVGVHTCSTRTEAHSIFAKFIDLHRNCTA